jgi:hypothetical protein
VATEDKEGAIRESERCQRKLELANRLITALASEGERWAMTVEQLRKDYEVRMRGRREYWRFFGPIYMVWVQANKARREGAAQVA